MWLIFFFTLSYHFQGRPLNITENIDSLFFVCNNDYKYGIWRGGRMKRHLAFFLHICLIVGFFSTGKILPSCAVRCNGYQELATRRYNKVAYAAAHNGQSHKESDVHNQDQDLFQQLKSGIRAIKIHIWYDKDAEGKSVPFVCHGIDKKYLYELPADKIVEQVPFFYKPFASALLEKIEPVKHIFFDAFEAAYGKDNATGLIQFNHCVLDPAARPLKVALSEIKTFLDAHPHEVVTVILEDHTKNLDSIAADFAATQLDQYVHTQDVNVLWPTLQEMIQANKRLVVFLHGEEKLPYEKYPWMHYLWNFAWDTRWEFKNAQDFTDESLDIMPNRGKEAFSKKMVPDNKIFIVHHFLTEQFGGSKQGAKKVNKKQVIKSRIERLARQANHIPNIIQVDFFQYPNNDIFDMVNELNGVGIYAGKPLCRF